MHGKVITMYTIHDREYTIDGPCVKQIETKLKKKLVETLELSIEMKNTLKIIPKC